MNFARQLYDLNKLFIGRFAADLKPCALQSLSKLRIEFVAMAVALANLFSAMINLARKRAFRKTTGPSA